MRFMQGAVPHRTTAIDPARSRATVARLGNVLSRAFMVFAGNRTLGRYASGFASSVHVVPTTLEAPEPVTRPMVEASEIRVGWIGNAKNLYY